MLTIEQFLRFLLTGLLWGATNPFINSANAKKDKKEGKSTSKQRQKDAENRSKIAQIAAEIFAVFRNWRFLLPFGLNQLGSVSYTASLQSAPVSLALPVCNALALLFTALVSNLLGEKRLTARGWLGIALIVAGVAVSSS
ncbi:MAG: hypothetical protein MHM6MM_007299 [Cercozoa sp. M6MM]